MTVPLALAPLARVMRLISLPVADRSARSLRSLDSGPPAGVERAGEVGGA